MAGGVSSEFPFDSNFIEVGGSDVHYIDVGSGDPILFLHGNPTWSYLWRNVIPHLQPKARCIAPDLIGMGMSDKPDIDYTFEDHFGYIEGFIGELGLEDITLVVHDWGSGIGFHYARMNPNNVAAIAFMEALIRPLRWEWIPVQLSVALRLWRNQVAGWLMFGLANLFVNLLMPLWVVRDLPDEVLDRYREPYPTVASRKPVRVWPQEIPISGSPTRVHDKIAAYSEWLTETEIPKLCLDAHPGVLGADSREGLYREYIESNFPNTTVVDLGKSRHYVQEDHPHRIGEEIASWWTII